MSKRLSDEDVERIADALAKKIQPAYLPIWIDPRAYRPEYPGYHQWPQVWCGTSSTSATIKTTAYN